MTSFADDNRMILNASRRKYNNSESNATVARESATESRPPVMRRNEPQKSAVAQIIDRRKKYVQKKKQEFAIENRRVIRESFEGGTNKVEYHYDEYTVKERNFPVSTVAIAFALTVIAVFLLMNFSQISKYNDMINKLDAEMAENAKTISELDMLVERQTDLSEIEEFAGERGLVKADRIDTQYINMSGSYKIVKMPSGDDGESVNTAMSGVATLLSEVFGG